MADSSNTHPYSNITRRNVLQFAAGAGAISLAGCFGTSPGDDDETNETEYDFEEDDPGTNPDERDLDGDPIEDEFTAAPIWNVPTDMQWNEFNFVNYEFLLGEFMHDPLAIWNARQGEHIPCLAEDWNIDYEAEVFELTIRDDYYWFNGDNVTAEDVYIHFELEQYMGFSSSNFVESPEITGDYSLEIPLRGQFNETVAAIELLRQDLTHAPYDRYGDFLEDFENAASEEEIEEIQAELFEYSPEEPMAFGPFEPVNFTESEVQFELHENHPAADDINFTQFTWVQTRDLNDQWQALRAGHYDALTEASAPTHIEEEFPDEIATVAFRDHDGGLLMPNHDHEPFGDRRVRTALAHYMDNETIAGNVDENVAIPVENQSGLSDEMAADWIDDLDSFNDHSFDLDRAAELLQDAGLSQDDDGNWMLENGDPFELEIKVDAGQGDAITAAQTITDQFREVGIQAEVFTVEGGTLFDDAIPNGDYELAMATWDGDYNTPFHMYHGASGLGEDAREDYRYPEEVSLPPVGDPDDEERTYHLEELIGTLREARDDEYRQGVQELAWVWNYDMPMIQIYEGITREYVNTEKWYWPSTEDDSMVPPPTVWATKYGALQAQTE